MSPGSNNNNRGDKYVGVAGICKAVKSVGRRIERNRGFSLTWPTWK
jgi:hypothetical protein